MRWVIAAFLSVSLLACSPEQPADTAAPAATAAPSEEDVARQAFDIEWAEYAKTSPSCHAQCSVTPCEAGPECRAERRLCAESCWEATPEAAEVSPAGE